VIDGEVALAAWESPTCPLTRRETEILRLTADGAEVGEIADKLFLSSGTVRNYLTAIVSKLNARTRMDAVRLACDAGWI
jgi:two-component system response regulator DesR